MVRMARLTMVLLLISLSSVALSTTLYRWVDDEGRIHFSDQPQEGAEEVTVRSPSTFESQKAPVQRPQAPREQEKAFKYESIAVVQPTSEQTLWNIGGELNVNIALRPGLRPGHKLKANLNGKTIELDGTNSFTLTEVYRGEQNLSVSVSDGSGKELIRSPTVRFFVQQARAK